MPFRRVPYADNRTTALLGASTDLLERLDVWPRCRDNAAALPNYMNQENVWVAVNPQSGLVQTHAL